MTIVQDNFLDELRDLMFMYNVEVHKCEDGSYELITRDVEPDNEENYIQINIDKI